MFKYLLLLHSLFLYARMSIVAGFVSVQSRFLQLFLTQTWVKCTSLDSSRSVVYFGTRFMAIWRASKKY